MAALKVPFGLVGNDLVSPSDVERGLKCGCTCPGCGAKLVANHPKSDSRRKYFSHHANTGCSTGYESALHLAAKKVLMENKIIMVPGISAYEDIYDKDTQASDSADLEIPSKLINLDKVEEEVRDYDGIVPDIVAEYQGRKIFVEIAVTHFVDDNKLAKLKQLGHPTLEIWLENADETPTMDEIKQLVIYDKSNRDWLVNNKRLHLESLVKKEAKRKLELSKGEVIAQRRRLKEKHEAYLRLPDNEKLIEELNFIDLSPDKVQSIIGIKVTGSMSFGVSNQVWQAAIYRKFIHAEQYNEFSSREVFNFLKDRFIVKPEFKDSPQIAIFYYLKFLQKKSLLAYRYNQEFEVIRDITGKTFPS